LLDLKLLVADKCSHCSSAKMAVNSATEGLEDQVSVQTVNLSNNLPEALHFKAAATPSVVINGKIEFMGNIDESQLRRRIMELI
jgi:protein-disulfide isomerase